MKTWLRLAAPLAIVLGMHGIAAAADESRAFTPTDLNRLARVSDPQVSPDGRYVVYSQRDADLEANRGRTDLWLVDLDSPESKPRRLTQHSANDDHARWSSDGGNIYFLSTRSGTAQIWRLPLDGGEAIHHRLLDGYRHFQAFSRWRTHRAVDERRED